MALDCGHYRQPGQQPKEVLFAVGLCPVCPNTPTSQEPHGRRACSCCGQIWAWNGESVRYWMTL